MIKRAISLPQFTPHSLPLRSLVLVASRNTTQERQITEAERTELLLVLAHLGVAYCLSFTKLSRRLGKTTDIQRVIKIHKNVTIVHCEEIATCLGLTLAELRQIKKLPVYKVDILREYLRVHDLMRSW